MLLDEREIALLARFLAKRFPHADDRAPLLDRAGLVDSRAEEPVAAWHEIVTDAQEERALGRLGAALRVDDPDDANLREVRRLLADEPRGWNLAAAVLGGVAALALIGVVAGAWALGSRAIGASDAVAASPEPAVVVAAPVATVAAVEQDDPDPAPVAPVAAPVPPAPAPVAVAPVPVAEPVGVAPDGDTRALAADHCANQEGTVGGWWYAGSESPGKAGDVITLTRDAFVRAEVPGTANRWNSKTAVQCVLYVGDKIRLSADPVPVPVDAWWVPTKAADVVVAGGKKVSIARAGR